MACYRVDLFTLDPQPVLDWIEASFPETMVIRAVGYRVTSGWVMKCVFKRQEDAEAFHRQWLPDREDHSVRAWGSPTTDRDST